MARTTSNGHQTRIAAGFSGKYMVPDRLPFLCSSGYQLRIIDSPALAPLNFRNDV